MLMLDMNDLDNRLSKNSAEPSLRSESTVCKAARTWSILEEAMECKFRFAIAAVSIERCPPQTLSHRFSFNYK
jgi:hypothetical protein